ncbi:MAG: response regulator transcription factor [Caulobacteraceae bacterium]
MERPDHLLIVDDDQDIRSLLAENLRSCGFEVSTAAGGAELRRAVETGSIDLIVLDLNLPGEDGLTLCRELRSKPSSPPIIMLTARAEPIDRILGLEMGADDYLPKPFEPRELLARIKSVLRRARALPANLEPLPAKRARFADWTLDFEHRRLESESGRIIMLSGAEFRLLRTFVDHANRVLSREQLLAFAPARGGESLDRAIDLQVSRLRQKLRRPEGDVIRTVRNEGYVLASPVTFE